MSRCLLADQLLGEHVDALVLDRRPIGLSIMDEYPSVVIGDEFVECAVYEVFCYGASSDEGAQFWTPGPPRCRECTN